MQKLEGNVVLRTSLRYEEYKGAFVFFVSVRKTARTDVRRPRTFGD